MHRIGIAACFAAALAVVPFGVQRAGAAGIYQDASAESALLLAPASIVVRATLEYSAGESADGSVYRLAAAFPVRKIFLISIDQPFVALTDSSIETGLGDLTLRGRARVLGSSHRALYLQGYLGTGSGNRRFFPYSSQTIDWNLSASFADSLGAVTVWAIAGLTWVNHVPENDPAVATHTDHFRVSAGASLRVASRVQVDAGALVMSYENDTRRDLLFATGTFGWTKALAVFAQAQFETGPVGDRATDWGAIVGASVAF